MLHNVISEGDAAEDSSLLAHDTKSGGSTHPMTQPHISEDLHLHQTLLSQPQTSQLIQYWY